LGRLVQKPSSDGRRGRESVTIKTPPQEPKRPKKD